MEWDQWLFAKADRFLKKLFADKRQKAAENKGYVVYRPEVEASRWSKFFCLLTGINAEPVMGDNKFSFSQSNLTFPETLFLFRGRDAGCLFMSQIILLLAAGIATGKQTFYYRLRYILRTYPNALQIWQAIRQRLQQLRRDDPAHYRKLVTLLTDIPTTPPETQRDSAKQWQLNEQDNQPSKSESRKKADMENALEIEKDQTKIDEYTLGHNFEKIDTAEEFEGQWRDLDGSDEMAEQENALSEVKLKYFIRSDDISHSTLENDRAGAGSLEIKEENNSGKKYLYDEWDYRKKQYRPHHCALLEETAGRAGTTEAQEILQRNRYLLLRLEKRLTSLFNRRRSILRVNNGNDFDLDGLIGRYADLKAGRTPDENVYTRQQKIYPDIDLSFLIDISLSTDSWLDGRRIIDAEKESLLLFGQALDNLKIPFQIHAFCSRTRNRNYFIKVKSTDDHWQDCRNHLANLQPVGYTRIGPALRHSASLMKTSTTRRKWIVLLTDGRPNDYDRYEGRYGEEDIRQVNRELTNMGIKLYTLAFMLREKPTIPRMMTAGHYRILQHPRQLLDSLENFFRAVSL